MESECRTVGFTVAQFNRARGINESVGSVFLTHFFDSFLKYEIRVQELLKFEVSIPTGRKVSGITGFYEFLEAYYNPKHPEHKEMRIM